MAVWEELAARADSSKFGTQRSTPEPSNRPLPASRLSVLSSALAGVTRSKQRADPVPCLRYRLFARPRAAPPSSVQLLRSPELPAPSTLPPSQPFLLSNTPPSSRLPIRMPRATSQKFSSAAHQPAAGSSKAGAAAKTGGGGGEGGTNNPLFNTDKFGQHILKVSAALAIFSLLARVV